MVVGNNQPDPTSGPLGPVSCRGLRCAAAVRAGHPAAWGDHGGAVPAHRGERLLLQGAALLMLTPGESRTPVY